MSFGALIPAKRIRFEEYNPNFEKRNWKVYKEYFLVTRSIINEFLDKFEMEDRTDHFNELFNKVLPDAKDRLFKYIEKYMDTNELAYNGFGKDKIAMNNYLKIEKIVEEWANHKPYVIALDVNTLANGNLELNPIESEGFDGLIESIIISVITDDESVLF